VTKDGISETDWKIRDGDEWSETVVTYLMLEPELTDPFSIVIEGVASLDYWSTNEVVDPNLYLLCAIVVHLGVGGWDTSLSKMECYFL
jgi:hypothetical protein